MEKFSHNDGIVLYSISNRFNSIGAIIGTIDYYYREALTYDEFDISINRLITNGYIVKHNNKFKQTVRAKNLGMNNFFTSVSDLFDLVSSFESVEMENCINELKRFVDREEYEYEMDKRNEFFRMIYIKKEIKSLSLSDKNTLKKFSRSKHIEPLEFKMSKGFKELRDYYDVIIHNIIHRNFKAFLLLEYQSELHIYLVEMEDYMLKDVDLNNYIKLIQKVDNIIKNVMTSIASDQ